MRYVPLPTSRVLAIDPISRGFGFAVLESDPLQLVDWGTAQCDQRNADRGRAAAVLLRRYAPTLLVLEHATTARTARRRAALDRAHAHLIPHFEGVCPVHRVTRHLIVAAHAELGVRSKEHLVQVLVARFPELGGRIPPKRFLWQSEDARFAIFDAVLLALATLSLAEVPSE